MADSYDDRMTEPKARLSATVDVENFEAARLAVEQGRAANVSAYVNEALARQREHDVRLHALGEFIENYEANHGEFSDEEMHALVRKDKARATVVRGSPQPARARSRRAKSA